MSNVVTIPKKLKDICGLYLKRHYDEADALLDKFNKLPHHKAAVLAQKALFSWDFNSAIDLCFEFVPYLSEWHSYNMRSEGIAMLTFAGTHCRTDEVIAFFEKLRNDYADADKDDREKVMLLSMINQSLDILHGNMQTHGSPFTAPECPISIEDIRKNHLVGHYEKYADRDDAEAINHIMMVANKKCSAEDYIKLYEMHPQSPDIRDRQRLTAIHAYAYLGDNEKAQQAVIDYWKFGWLPIERTDIMPLDLFPHNCDIWHLFTKDVFSEIYNSCNYLFSEEEKSSEDSLPKSSTDFEWYFRPHKIDKLTVTPIDIGKVTITDSSLIVCDPLVYLDEDTLPFTEKVPTGSFNVSASAVNLDGDKRIAAVSVNFSSEKAEKYSLALNGTESPEEIASLAEGEYFGFPVDGGLACICDANSRDAYCAFEKKMHEQNPGGNMYDDVLSDEFSRSAEKSPEHQSKYGDYIDFVIPETDIHIPMFSSGFGDGCYPVYFGYTSNGKLCSAIIHFIDLKDIKQ